MRHATLVFALLCATACGPTVVGAPGAGASTTTTTGTTTQTSTPCSSTMACDEGQFCHWADGQCGKGQPTGVCEQAPVSDCGLIILACGCDGAINAACGDAVGIGNATDITSPDLCPKPDGTFVCGNYFCSLGNSSVCFAQMNLDTCGWDDSCSSMPPECVTNPSCACIQAHWTLGGTVGCTGDATSGFFVQGLASDSPSCP
jgi:hypothetical protein